jgi:hypothetical protein
VTRQLGFENPQLPEAVGELRILGFGVRMRNGVIEATEDLLERVVVAFAVAARQIGVGARACLQ